MGTFGRPLEHPHKENTPRCRIGRSGTLIAFGRVSQARIQMTSTWLLYDGDCRICTAFAHWARSLDLRGQIAIRPLQKAGDLLPGIQAAEILHAARAVSSDGRLWEGAEALLVVLAALLDGQALRALLLRSPPAVAAARRGYAILVEFRGHLTCRVDGTEVRTEHGGSGAA